MKTNYLIISLLVILIGLTTWNIIFTHKVAKASILLVSKEEMNVRVVDYSGVVLCKFPVACGANYGNKQIEGDKKTPEGIFRISEIVNATEWTHDFGDGKGEVKGAYGPLFMRLETPGHKGIGIHGTCKPESIGTRDSEGCIRLENNNLLELRKRCKVGMPVIVTPSSYDALCNAGFDSLVLKCLQGCPIEENL